jgi:hypothetical protein
MSTQKKDSSIKQTAAVVHPSLHSNFNAEHFKEVSSNAYENIIVKGLLPSKSSLETCQWIGKQVLVNISKSDSR